MQPIAAALPETAGSIAALTRFCARHVPVFVLTGAGCSTASGIPAYRDRSGARRHAPPVMYRDFLDNEATRVRYWKRSMAGWPRVAGARPAPSHLAIAALQSAGVAGAVVTQNVDGLHRRAGTRDVLELHGTVARVCCLDCGQVLARAAMQSRLWRANPAFRPGTPAAGPDGDAAPECTAAFTVPSCPACGGILKPDVVFHGENVPAPRVADALARLAACRGLLVVGSSLSVYSGYRYCLAARDLGLPLAALNQGDTRAEALLDLKVDMDCAVALPALAARLASGAHDPVHEVTVSAVTH